MATITIKHIARKSCANNFLIPFVSWRYKSTTKGFRENLLEILLSTKKLLKVIFNFQGIHAIQFPSFLYSHRDKSH